MSVRKFAFEILAGLFCLGSFVGNLSAQVPQTDSKTSPEKYDVHDFSLSEDPTTIPDRLSKTSGDLTISNSEEVGLQAVLPDLPGEPPFRVLSLTCNANLVVTGTATSGVSHMTARKTFLYTDWKFAIQEVLKNNPEVPVGVGSVITVARAGGTLKIDGRTVRAKVLHFADFESGRPYLLYLEFIPKTKAYRAEDNNTIPLFGQPGDDRASQDPSKLLDETRAAVSFEAGRSEGDWSTCAGKEGAQ